MLKHKLIHMKISFSIIIGFVLIIGSTIDLKAQLNPLHAQYFNNRYLGNAAMAGIEKGLTLNLSHRSQLTDLPGAPTTQNFTADYGYQRLGVGLNVTVDKAGLQNYVRALASYAYHLPISKETLLHFGFSVGVIRQRLSTDDINGSIGDNLVDLYNQRKAQFDGDFGIALTTRKISAEVSLPNINSLIKKENRNLSNLPIAYAAVSYKLDINNAELEPRVAFRGIRGLDPIVDAGAQLSFAKKQLQFNGMYHTSGSATLGAGLNYKSKYFLGFSHTFQTTSISNYTNGDFEFNLRIKL